MFTNDFCLTFSSQMLRIRLLEIEIHFQDDSISTESTYVALPGLIGLVQVTCEETCIQ